MMVFQISDFKIQNGRHVNFWIFVIFNFFLPIFSLFQAVFRPKKSQNIFSHKRNSVALHAKVRIGLHSHRKQENVKTAEQIAAKCCLTHGPEDKKSLLPYSEVRKKLQPFAYFPEFP